MKIRISSIILVGLCLVTFCGLQGGKFFMHNRAQELGIGVLVLLFSTSVYLASFKIPLVRWLLWATLIPFFIITVMITWSAVFSINAGTPILPSIFASREFLWLLLAPTLFLLFRSGLDLGKMKLALLAGIFMSCISYLYFYYTLDLKAAYLSDDPFTHHLVTYDENRGFRLKPPTYAGILLALTSIFLLVNRNNAWKKLLGLAGVTLAVYIWTLVHLRAVAAGVALALILYPLLWRKRRHKLIAMTLLPLAPIMAYMLFEPMLVYMQQAHGGTVRLDAFQIALREFDTKWLFGWGQSSGYSKTYQDLFGPKFFPSDLGIVGITFKYGIIGAVTYVSACIFVLLKAVSSHWKYIDLYGTPSPFFQALTVFMTAMALNIVLWPGLAYAQGLTVIGIVTGLGACIAAAHGTVQPDRKYCQHGSISRPSVPQHA